MNRTRPAIRGLETVAFPTRGRVMVVGANGSGKTTALLSLAGLVGGAPFPIPAPVGLLLQDAEVGWGASTVFDEVVFGLGGGDAAVLARAHHVLAALELTPLATRDPRTLSAGEMQRVQLAAVIARQPKTLLLDEPTAHLDPARAHQLRTFIASPGAESVDLVVETATDLEFVDGTDLVVVVHERAVVASDHPSVVLAEDVTRWDLVPNDAMEVAASWGRPIVGTFASLDASLDGGGALTLDAAEVIVDRGNGTPIFRAVNLRAAPGEVIAVLGPSGSGKTSLVLTLAGARSPLAGEIRLPPRPHVGVLPAFPERHFVSFTVEEEVEADGAVADAAAALRSVGLPTDRSFLERSPWGLSLGEQRRVAIASNLVRARKLLVWDEPTASLDPRERTRLADVVRTLATSGTAILVTGHDLQWAAGVGARLAGILDGSLRELDLALLEDRKCLLRMGYEIPRLWAFFEERVPDFWSGGGWRRSAGELARLATSSNH